MMLATRPELALSWISSLGLYPVVFAVPTTLIEPIDMTVAARESAALVRTMICASRSISLDWSHEERRLAVLAAALLPFNGCNYTTPKRRVDTVANYVVLESLKHPKHDADQVSTLHFGVTQFERLFKPDHVLAPGEPGIQNIPLDQQRVALGKVMRRVGPLWHTALILATLEHLPTFSSELTVEAVDPHFPSGSPILETYLSIKRQIEHLRMVGIWDMKPFFTGDDIIATLQLQPGPVLGVALEQELEWMLSNLDEVITSPQTAKEKCKAFIESDTFKEKLTAINNATRGGGGGGGNKKKK